MTVKMTRYKKADFEEDISSIGSVQLTEGVSTTATHIRYHTVGLRSIWKGRTALEKCLLVAFGCLLVMVLVLASLITSSPPARYITHPITNPGEICLSDHCVVTAATLISSLDATVDPCQDFYEFACGRWVQANPIPDGKSMWSTFVKLDQQNQLIVKNLLEKPFEELKGKAEKKAKLYYMSCIDANETVDAKGSEPMLRLLKETGGWSISGDFEIKSWKLQTKLQTLQNRYNFGGLFQWAIQEDDRNSTLHIIQVDQGGLGLPTREMYLNATANEKILNAYLEYMTQVGVLLGGDKNTTKDKMREIIEFETRLARITVPAEDRRDEEKFYNNMAIAELQELAPFINWLEYFSDALRTVGKKINDKRRVVVYAPDYLSNLTVIIEEYSNTTERQTVLNDYMVWQMVRSLTSYLSKPYRDAYKILRKALVGSEGGEETWRYCVSDTSNVLGFAVGAMYVRDVFNWSSKAMAEQMIDSIRTAFKENLKELKWMDKATKELAESKADMISDMIGFPDYILNPKQLDEKYKDLEVSENNYFQNNINANTYILKENLKKLDTPVNKTRWNMTPPTVNAYYTPTKNQIAFPAGILQTPFYDANRIQALNFGAMGVVMGHELTHAFDDQGREYDEKGNMHQWWNNKTIEKFKKQAECIEKQYSKYQIDGKYVNGKRTLGENIADNGGLKAAYRAYLDWADKNPSEPSLPGLILTHKQLFFLSFAQVWCSESTEEAMELQMEKDAHSPPRVRVIGSLSNSRDFNAAFSCPLGSKMNPANKCELW